VKFTLALGLSTNEPYSILIAPTDDAGLGRLVVQLAGWQPGGFVPSSGRQGLCDVEYETTAASGASTVPAKSGCHAESRAAGSTTPTSPTIGSVSMTTRSLTGTSLTFWTTPW